MRVRAVGAWVRVVEWTTLSVSANAAAKAARAGDRAAKEGSTSQTDIFS